MFFLKVILKVVHVVLPLSGAMIKGRDVGVWWSVVFKDELL